jgi:hypothetical protein
MPTKYVIVKWLCDYCSDVYDDEHDCAVHECRVHFDAEQAHDALAVDVDLCTTKEEHFESLIDLLAYPVEHDELRKNSKIKHLKDEHIKSGETGQIGSAYTMFECTIGDCEDIYYCSQNALDRHKHVAHNIEPTFECHECQELFARPAQLNRHKRLRGHSQPFKCSKCVMEFRSIRTLEVHI